MSAIASLETRTPAARRRSRLPSGAAFAGNAVTFISLYLAAGAPTPLLPFYQEQWHFPAAVLTLAFAVYAIGFLAAMLTVGSLSDHVGRRPVLIGALLVQLAATLMFLVAPDIGWVIAARVVQGLATGAATSAFTATLAELAPPNRKRLGSILGSVGMTAGLAVGALLAGFAIQFTPEANTIIFTVLTIVTVLGIVVVALSPESVTRTPGALRSLIPRVFVPPAASKEFAAAAPVIAAVWMLAGLSLGLAPTIVRSVFHLNSGLVNGLSGFIAPATSAVVGVAFARFSPRRGMTTGIYSSIAGTVVIVAAVLSGSLALMIAGLVVMGIGFGAAFSASLRLIMPLAVPQQRAGIVAAIYVVAYIAFGLPVIIAGQLAAPLGLLPTVVGYGGATVALALVSLVAQMRISRGRQK
ncbi:MFS transporter [Arthrobacter sp. NicSoilB8]|uniref:MFS transporter n=1 Tax=Arthrobacter sp. NicSoilB8 TaxID=2830998 RepID=UPI001CC70897|nr:MFS transporter [Arthrobacter sp. NicSoilB8]BCW71631.1 MFS transporter [Arthrobacter sp. NicSoilB8]